MRNLRASYSIGLFILNLLLTPNASLLMKNVNSEASVLVTVFGSVISINRPIHTTSQNVFDACAYSCRQRERRRPATEQKKASKLDDNDSGTKRGSLPGR